MEFVWLVPTSSQNSPAEKKTTFAGRVNKSVRTPRKVTWWNYLDHVFLKHSGKKNPLESSCVHTYHTLTLPDRLWLCGLRSVRVSLCQKWSLPLWRTGGLVATCAPHMFWVLLSSRPARKFLLHQHKHLIFNLYVSKHHSLEYYRPTLRDTLQKNLRDIWISHTC